MRETHGPQRPTGKGRLLAYRFSEKEMRRFFSTLKGLTFAVILGPHQKICSFPQWHVFLQREGALLTESMCIYNGRLSGETQVTIA